MIDEIGDLAARLQAITDAGGTVDNDEAWSLLGDAAAGFLPVYTVLDWDGLKNEIFEPVDVGTWAGIDSVELRLLATNVADLKAAVISFAYYKKEGQS